MDLPTARVREYSRAQELDAIPLPYEPAVLRGLVQDWPAVAAARTAQGAVDYLLTFDKGAKATAFIAPPEVKGRFFYTSDMSAFNFGRREAYFRDIVRYAAALGREEDPSIYVGAAALPEVLPGFAEANSLSLPGPDKAIPRIWIGGKTQVSTHFDLSHNIACVVTGRRRFVLFPPEQLPNLYVGPLDHTMAGQPTSMVDVHNPDFDRHPRFRDAMAVGQVAELEPGDAIYVPTLWWHHVDALDPFNVLVNHWWEPASKDAGSPFEALVHGILAISHFRPEMREAWRQMFDHYVFQTNGSPVPHLAPEQRGILAPPNPSLRRRIREFLIRGLNRS